MWYVLWNSCDYKDLSLSDNNHQDWEVINFHLRKKYLDKEPMRASTACTWPDIQFSHIFPEFLFQKNRLVNTEERSSNLSRHIKFWMQTDNIFIRNSLLRIFYHCMQVLWFHILYLKLKASSKNIQTYLLVIIYLFKVPSSLSEPIAA